MKPFVAAIVFALSMTPLGAAAEEAHSGHATGNSDVAKAFTAANAKMMQDTMVTPTGDADRDFVLMMIPHHQGAIDMAKIELQYGGDPGLRAMAEGIIAAQEAEIAELKAWLKKNGS